MKHTPGPWHFGEGDRRIPAGVGSYTKAPLCRMVGSDADDIANARLISAAPDLYAALVAVMGGQIGGNVDTDAERFRLARAAIAKAEGTGND